MRAKLFIIVLLAATTGFFAYRYLSKRSEPTAPPVVAETEPQPEATPAVTPRVETKVAPRNNIATTAPAKNMAATAPPPAPAPEWKPKLDEILGSNFNMEQKHQKIRELLASLPEREAEQAVQALTLTVPDEAYAFIKPLAVDPTMPEAVRDEFMVDLLNRPNSIRVPLFLELARNPDHPDNENAYDMLEIFTSQKLGADWAGWEKAIAGWLKENPDQPRRNRTAGTAPPDPVEQ